MWSVQNTFGWTTGGISTSVLDAANNGLTISTNGTTDTVQLGGTLIQNTSIEIDSYTLSFTKNIFCCLQLSASTGLHLGEAIDITTGTTTGTKIGSSTSQKIGFWNATPIIQPASTNQAALTNSTGGTYDGTLVDVATLAIADPSKINSNFTDIFTLLDAMRIAMVTSGIMKGSA